MSTLNSFQLINLIAKGNFETVVIGSEDDKTPLEAVSFLCDNNTKLWNYSTEISKGCLNVWEQK